MGLEDQYHSRQMILDDEGISSPSGILPPDISIVLDHYSMDVDVYPGTDGVMTFEGTVYCDLPPSTPPGQECLVFLIADAGGFAVSNPPALTFSRTISEERFSIEVQVPPKTSSSEQKELQVSGKWRYSPGTTQGIVEGTSADIIINPYCALKFGTEDPVKKASVGDWVEYDIVLKNDGNSDSNVTIEIKADDNIEVEIESYSIIVREKSEYRISLRAKQTDGMGSSNAIYLKAISSLEGETNEATAELYLTTHTSIKNLLGLPFLIIISALLMIGAVIISIVVIRKRRMQVMENI